MTSISILSSASHLTAYCLTHMVITVKMVHALNTINDLTFEPKYVHVHVGPYSHASSHAYVDPKHATLYRLPHTYMYTYYIHMCTQLV